MQVNKSVYTRPCESFLPSIPYSVTLCVCLSSPSHGSDTITRMSDDRGAGLEAVVILLLILTIVSTSLRCYSMGVILRRFYIEDWLAMVCLV